MHCKMHKLLLLIKGFKYYAFTNNYHQKRTSEAEQKNGRVRVCPDLSLN